MGGGSDAPEPQVVESTPFLAGDVRFGAKQARGLLEGQQPQFFPGETVAGFAPETEQGLQAITQRATAGSPLTGASQDLLLQTLQGGFLNQNPFIDQVISNVTGDIGRQFNQQIVPQLDARFGLAGRPGSGAEGLAFGSAADRFLGTVGDVSSQIRFANFQSERNRQQQALGLAPLLAGQDFTDAQAVLSVGGARQGLEQARISEDVQRFNFEQTSQQRALDDFINRISSATTYVLNRTCHKAGKNA